MKKRGKKFFDRDIILLKLAEIGETTIENLFNISYDLLFTVLNPPKSVSEALHRPMAQPLQLNIKEFVAWRVMLSRMRRESLISTQSERIRLTKIGKDYVKHRKFLWRRMYVPMMSDEVIIVSFDVPERRRHWRDWLRFQLASLGLQKLQLSVWIGKVKLPEEFLEDLKKFQLLTYVHILSVGKKGTLKDYLDY